MSKILVKGIMLKGRYSGPADKYYEPPPGPADLDIKETYKRIEKFLKLNGKPIIPKMVDPLPLINEGVISGAAVASCYTFNDCLIANQIKQYFNGTAHVIQVAAKLENESAIDKLFKLLKWEAGWEWDQYWINDKERVVDIPNRLENITQLIPYTDKILTE